MEGSEVLIKARPSGARPGEGACTIEVLNDPCVMVIFGASGDLTSRKLMPALFNLFRNNVLPRSWAIVGCGRTPLTDEEFRERMRQALGNSPGFNLDSWPGFAASLHYVTLDYHEPAAFVSLAEELRSLDREVNAEGNRVYYLALPPALYGRVSRNLGSAGLAREHQAGNGWSRIVVEKPFGHDVRSAVELDRTLHAHFQEHQIFRIDHYLAKETVQNILMFRFANSIFEPVWDRRFIDSVAITASEALGVEQRAGYYEQTGVLRDMFQNHMMQLLALIAMEPPSEFEADRVREEKAKVHRSLRPFPMARLQDHLIVGQYAAGHIDGVEVAGYREEPGVNPASLVPTFATMRVFVDNWRWQGVPFYLTSGKRLREKLTEIVIQFKEVPHSMFRHVLDESIIANRLALGIYPEEKISLTFQTKNPGTKLCLRSVTMDFRYHQDQAGPMLESYETVLVDVMLGDQMLFWREDDVELCWSFLTPILSECETCAYRDDMLRFYAAGTWGPGSLRQAAT